MPEHFSASSPELATEINRVYRNADSDSSFAILPYPSARYNLIEREREREI
jgi:hypothetical protein